MTSRLVKVEGAGNDFIAGIGGWAERLAAEPRLVQALCDRRRGVGADGALAVWIEAPDRIRVRHRNPDGSETAFCGNGTRCAARVAVAIAGCRSELVVATGWAEIAAEVHGAEVTLELPPPPAPPRAVQGQAAGQRLGGWALTVGVPHLVVAVGDPAALDLRLLAPPLRHHPELGPAGANVHFVANRGGEPMVIRSWERGVEGETLACGSGVVAAALLAMVERSVRQLRVRVASGDVLTVTALGEPPACRTRLAGATRIVAEIVPGADLLAG